MSTSPPATELTSATSLQRVVDAQPAWPADLDDPLVIAKLTDELRDQLQRQSAQLAAIRSRALHEPLKTRSRSEVGRLLGISRQAVTKAIKVPPMQGAQR
ncbi:MAG: hypothetical protein QM621_02025 [Aeromicrobium sp.]|uniref:hypothetical protein n=1 Tax=Aeromicrobium sp. TaxID=1871063 RepID=UPI0039E4B3A1